MGERCPICGATSIYFDPARGEYYCPVCGYVYGYEEVPAHHDQIQAKHDIENVRFKWTGTGDDTKNYTLSEIRRIAANLHLPKYIIKEAERIYSRVYNADLHRKKGIAAEALAPAVLMAACGIHDVYLDMQRVYYFAKASPLAIMRAYIHVHTFSRSKTLMHNTIEGEG
ncbi:MAG: hypothetical protein H0Z19_11475 [Archaeoglobus sp.]|uniref:TFIIB-type zinc ribbon-containing protein n=1 Tax=Archaeoglobus sp. TaxID=1872626 RepID=UPI001DF1F75C|nr:TFIIB-type zinc ribbon-containing protein [Archaeoglobus sp.]MBO8180843.1 hypothetical protein [Archaeoglobus sp.]MBO8181068.1 hypothetical protein [Archaeoglobus sp.]